MCSLTIGYWDTEGKISVGVWITVFFVLILITNLFGTLGYAEEEFWSAIIKLSATVVFIIIAFVMVLGGGPSNGRFHEYWGARLWYEPGAFNNGFLGFCSVFVTVGVPRKSKNLLLATNPDLRLLSPSVALSWSVWPRQSPPIP